MSNIREKGDLFDKIIKDTGITKYKYTLVNSEKREINLENGEFKLFRTVFSNSGSIKVFKDNKTGSASGNDISEEGLKGLAKDALVSAESSQEDPAHDIAPKVDPHVFKQGVLEPDIDKFLERIKELLDTIAKEYPLVKVFASTGSYDRYNWFSRNSNGTEFEGFGGSYGISIEICATDGKATTGMDYTGGLGLSPLPLALAPSHAFLHACPFSSSTSWLKCYLLRVDCPDQPPPNQSVSPPNMFLPTLTMI